MKNTQTLNYKAKANAHAKAKAKAKAKANTNAKAKSKSKSKSKRLSLVTHELDPTPAVGSNPTPGDFWVEIFGVGCHPTPGIKSLVWAPTPRTPVWDWKRAGPPSDLLLRSINDRLDVGALDARGGKEFSQLRQPSDGLMCLSVGHGLAKARLHALTGTRVGPVLLHCRRHHLVWTDADDG